MTDLNTPSTNNHNGFAPSYLQVSRSSDEFRKLIVTFSAHNNGATFAALQTLHRATSYDILCLRDPTNSYYLEKDGGERFDSIIRETLSHYDPARVTFFGSSMGGYAALKSAALFNGNCVINNPQLDLSISLQWAWPDLKLNIEKIPNRLKVQDIPLDDRKCAIVCVHGHHPMDIENIRILRDWTAGAPNVTVLLHPKPDCEHTMLIDSESFMLDLLNLSFQVRKCFP